MKRILAVVGVASLAGVVMGVGVLLYSPSATSQAKPFGDEASIAYSKQLWAVLEKARLVGKSAKADKPYEGQEPHGAILETLKAKVTVAGHTGQVIVKRNYGPAGLKISDVSADRTKHLKAVTVMFKREKGYDADNKDWFWVKFKPDGSLHTNPKGMMLAGRVAKGADKGCIACHSAAGDEDYMFTNDE